MVLFLTFIFIFAQIISAVLIGDFLIGVYHWIKDSYFTPLTPIIGHKYIWYSRLHHLRPLYITTLSDSQLFFDSMMWSLPLIIPLVYIFGCPIFFALLLCTISINDVVHKYNHNDQPNKFIDVLQDLHIIQSRQHHFRHHVDLHNQYYCSITPAINPLLRKIHFFEKLEYVIYKTTGVQPRIENYIAVRDDSFDGGIKFIA